MSHLDEMEAAGDLRERGMNYQLSGWTEGAVGLRGQVGQVRQQSRRVRVFRCEWSGDHGISFPQRDHRFSDRLSFFARPERFIQKRQRIREFHGRLRCRLRKPVRTALQNAD